MGKLYVPSKAHTAVDHVREALDQAEWAVQNLSDAGPRALELLHLLDQIDQELHDLEQRGVDLRVEKTRFKTVQSKLEQRKGRFLSQVGPALKEERERIEPARSRGWWYLDETAAEQRRRRLWRVTAGTAAVIALLAGAWLAYRQFLAPPPEVGQAFRRIEAGRSLAAEGDLRTALEDFDAATELTPDDPEPWLWKGALHNQLGEAAKAREAFAQAEPLYDTTVDFILNRGRVYLQAGDVERAKADVRTALDLDPMSDWGYYLRAGIAIRENDYDAALADLERAAQLAEAHGNGRLQAMATTQRAQLIQMLPLSTPE
jgi:tetratricopeptide (TPR) repeat protein